MVTRGSADPQIKSSEYTGNNGDWGASDVVAAAIGRPGAGWDLGAAQAAQTKTKSHDRYLTAASK